MIQFIQDVSSGGGQGRRGKHIENRLKYLYIYFVHQTDTHYAHTNKYIYLVFNFFPSQALRQVFGLNSERYFWC